LRRIVLIINGLVLKNRSFSAQVRNFVSPQEWEVFLKTLLFSEQVLFTLAEQFVFCVAPSAESGCGC